MPRILITPAVFFHIPGPYLDVLQSAGFETVHPPSLSTNLFDPQILIQQLEGIDAVLASVEPYTEEVFAASKLKAIARVGVGYDAIDVAAATRHGVGVAITPGTNEHSVAEQALSLIFGVFREVASRDQAIRQGRWVRKPLRRLAGNTIGLVGLGRIGKAMVPRCQGLGLKVLAYDPFADATFAAAKNVQLRTLEQLLAESDIVSLHMPCTAETMNLINARTLALMKPGSVLINSARGGLVDEAALVDALKSGHLYGAGLDVFQVEPPPADHPLLSIDRVVVAPHMGGLDAEALDAMGKLAAECLVDLLTKGTCPQGCLVNLDALAVSK